MPRSIWNGTMSFGAVHVPVKLYSATESKTVHFHEVHLEDGARIEHRRFCAKEDKEVPYEEVVKGYEVASGEYVVLDKDEIKAAAGGTGHLIEVEHFVAAADIDPVFYEKSYFLGAGEKAQGRLSGAARRARAHRPGGGRALHVPQPRIRRDPAARGRARPAHAALRRRARRRRRLRLRAAEEGAGEREVKMAGQLVESLHEDFRPERYKDEYRQAVLDVIERKAAGEEIEPPAERRGRRLVDLMAALQASLDGGR